MKSTDNSPSYKWQSVDGVARVVLLCTPMEMVTHGLTRLRSPVRSAFQGPRGHGTEQDEERLQVLEGTAHPSMPWLLFGLTFTFRKHVVFPTQGTENHPTQNKRFASCGSQREMGLSRNEELMCCFSWTSCLLEESPAGNQSESSWLS